MSSQDAPAGAIWWERLGRGRSRVAVPTVVVLALLGVLGGAQRLGIAQIREDSTEIAEAVASSSRSEVRDLHAEVSALREVVAEVAATQRAQVTATQELARQVDALQRALLAPR